MECKFHTISGEIQSFKRLCSLSLGKPSVDHLNSVGETLPGINRSLQWPPPPTNPTAPSPPVSASTLITGISGSLWFERLCIIDLKTLRNPLTAEPNNGAPQWRGLAADHLSVFYKWQANEAAESNIFCCGSFPICAWACSFPLACARLSITADKRLFLFFFFSFFFLKETTGIKASFRIFSETLPLGGVFRFLSAAKGMQRSLRMEERTSCLGDSPGFFNEGLFPVGFVKSHPLHPFFPAHTLASVVFQLHLCNRLNFRFAGR